MKKTVVLVFLLVCMLLTSCGRGYTEDTFFCMDTVALIKVDANSDDTVEKCRELLEALDKNLSRHNENGQTAMFNASENGLELSDDVKELVNISQDISKQTGGAFTVFSGSLTALWNESITYPSEEKIKQAVADIEADPVFNGNILEKNNKNTMLEFGGIAKGYACDKAVEFFKNNGVTSGMVSFSSSIGVFGTNPDGQPWRIAVKNPIDTDKILGYVSLHNGFLSVSGDYERCFEIDGKKYNHIIDTQSGLPVDNGIHSVVVIAQSGAQSDALSTAFFVMGEKAVEDKYADSRDVKYLIVTDSGVIMNDSMKEIFMAEQ